MKKTALVICWLSCVAACQAVDEGPARWSYIHRSIIVPSCTTAGCHSALTGIGGVNLSGEEGAYTILTGHICGEPVQPHDPPRNYVTPFSSDYSQLIYQLRGSDADGRPYRDVMPPDTSLPNIEIELVARWIDEGAVCD